MQNEQRSFGQPPFNSAFVTAELRLKNQFCNRSQKYRHSVADLPNR
jgi:hypothetical protein